MIRVSLLITFVLMATFANAQESNYSTYIPTDSIDSLLIGQKVKPDFKSKRTTTQSSSNQRYVEDIVTLNINGVKADFVERRNHYEDRYFIEEFLESKNYKRGFNTRIYECILKKITKTEFLFHITLGIYIKEKDTVGFDVEEILTFKKILFDDYTCLREIERKEVDFGIEKRKLDGVLVNDASMVKLLSAYKKTEFVSTLEHILPTGKNAVYCASLPYAWQGLREELKDSLIIDPKQIELIELNKTTSHLNTLMPEEYSIKNSMTGDKIKIRSEFKLSLPFDQQLEPSHEEFKFRGEQVRSFGLYGSPSPTAQIVYYKNDSNFVIKLLPKNQDHEIILSISDKTYQTMDEIIVDIQNKTKTGEVECKSENARSKYEITMYDIVDIPKIQFNIQANYPTLEEVTFLVRDISLQTETVSQRTAFYLNNKGARLDTDAITEVVFGEAATDENIIPRLMVFKKPFFIMMKRKESNYPYFGLWVENTELMDMVN